MMAELKLNLPTTRISILLTEEERLGLVRLANKELRQPKEQLRVVLRAELEKHGLLETQEAGQP